ncbi:MAG: MoaF N-terminal domain-containing protein [Deltaproteobacteria bacterium]|nr:MoaF N-terminal domain-containing protein [Deltaproteobacteria bacterium]
MNTPMHRFKYTKLTKEQIGQKLKATEAGPECTSKFSDVLIEKSLKIVTKDGPVLDYSFKKNNKLTLSENGGKKVKAGYGALTLKQMVFFSHMIPESQKGYNVFVDLDTNLATVFEVWLSSGRKEKTLGRKEITVDDREVQRQIYFGYVHAEGQEPPERLHHYTNRIEGKGLYWKQDTGIETLEFYASVVSSNFVELTRHTDKLSYCSPSDYVLINDNMFIYDRTECEFSGIFTLFVADLFTETQAGVRIGFNERDELEYYMFRGRGKVVGQLAYLEPFDDHGKEPMFVQADSDPQSPGKGQRLVYRPVRDFQYMTDEEVHEAAMKSTKAFGGGIEAIQPMAGNNMPFTDMLVGKEFTLRYDNGGPVRHYKITEQYKLKYREDGETQWHEEAYRAYEADEKLVWFSHILTDSKPRASVQVALDLMNGLTTCIHSQMGTQYFGNETSYRAIFGVAEMEGLEVPQYVRHELTDELVGHAFSWSYSDQMTSMHLYTTPHSMSWTIFTENQTLGAQWGSPCIYVKVRDGVYIFVQNEEACNGAEMCVMINTKITHDCGFGFSGGAGGVNLSLTGAIGRHIGQFNVKKYFGLNPTKKGA